MRRPKSNSEGDTPVVECGVRRYLNRKREIRVSIESFEVFFMYSLNVCAALSARPFVAEWYGADVTCLMPF